MSLSVSSFPEAPPKLARMPKWQESLSFRCNGRPFGSFFSKRSVPFLKGIGEFAKSHVKGTIIHLRVHVPPSRSRHPSSPSKSSIQTSSIVIDIIPIPNSDECFSTGISDVDAPSTIDIPPLVPITPATISTPSTANDVSAVTTNPVKAELSSQNVDRDCAQTPEKIVQPPAKEHEEVVCAVVDSELHESQSSDSEATITLPKSPQPLTQSPAAPSTIVRRRSHSVSAGVKSSAKENAPPTRPRYKSETAIGSRRPHTPPDVTSSSERKGRGSVHASSPASPKQRQQNRETRSIRARSGASIRSVRSNEAAEFPLPSPPLPSAHMLSLRSGSRLPVPVANHPRPKVNDGASTRSRSRSRSRSGSRSRSSSLVALLDSAPQLPPLPSPLPGSVDKGQWLRLSTITHIESGIPVRDGLRPFPRSAPEVALTAS